MHYESETVLPNHWSVLISVCLRRERPPTILLWSYMSVGTPHLREDRNYTELLRRSQDITSFNTQLNSRLSLTYTSLLPWVLRRNQNKADNLLQTIPSFLKLRSALTGRAKIGCARGNKWSGVPNSAVGNQPSPTEDRSVCCHGQAQTLLGAPCFTSMLNIKVEIKMLQKYRYRSFKNRKPGLPMLHLWRIKQPSVTSSPAAFVKREFEIYVTHVSRSVDCKVTQRQTKTNPQASHCSQPIPSNCGHLLPRAFPVLAPMWRFQGLKGPCRTFSSFKLLRDGGWFSTENLPGNRPLYSSQPSSWWGEIIQTVYFFHMNTSVRILARARVLSSTYRHDSSRSLWCCKKAFLSTYNSYRESFPTPKCADNILYTIFKTKLV